MHHAGVAVARPCEQYVDGPPLLSSDLKILKIFSQLWIPRQFLEVDVLLEVLKTLSPDKVQQSLAEQMMTTSLSVAPTSSWSTLAASTCFPLMRKRRMRRRRRRSSSPCDSKALSGRGVFACTSSRGSADGARRAPSRTRTTSSTRTCRDSGDGWCGRPCDHASLSSSSRAGRARLRQRCHVHGWFCLWRCRSCCFPFPSQHAQAALIVDNGSGIGSRFCHALCSLWLTALIVDYGSGMARWFCLALCSLFLSVGKPWPSTTVVPWLAGFTWRSVPFDWWQGTALDVDIGSVMCMAGYAGTLCSSSVCRLLMLASWLWWWLPCLLL